MDLLWGLIGMALGVLIMGSYFGIAYFDERWNAGYSEGFKAGKEYGEKRGREYGKMAFQELRELLDPWGDTDSIKIKYVRQVLDDTVYNTRVDQLYDGAYEAIVKYSKKESKT